VSTSSSILRLLERSETLVRPRLAVIAPWLARLVRRYRSIVRKRFAQSRWKGLVNLHPSDRGEPRRGDRPLDWVFLRRWSGDAGYFAVELQ